MKSKNLIWILIFILLFGFAIWYIVNKISEAPPQLIGGCGTVTPGLENQCCRNQGFDFWNKETLQCEYSDVFCTQDAKLCPDGSWVGRSPPNCEFDACPL